MNDNAGGAATRMAEWRDTPAKRLLAHASLPLFYLLNRPALAWFGRAVFAFALRCNGFAINFKGKAGLSIGEEKFLAKTIASRTEGVFFDVGANHGAYTRLLRKLVPEAMIYAFEPHPRSFSTLQAEVSDPRSILVNEGLSDQAGELTLFDFAGKDGSTQASLSREAVGLFTEGVIEHAVKVTTLDEFMEAHGIERIDFLKVDTEGFDLAVLAGARRALVEGRIGIIQFEFIPANIVTKITMRDFIELLSTHTVSRLCMNGQLLPLTPYDVKHVEVYAMHNLIAVPVARAA